MTSSKINLILPSSPFHQTLFPNHFIVSRCFKKNPCLMCTTHLPISHFSLCFPATVSPLGGAVFPSSFRAFAHSVPLSGGVHLVNCFSSFRSQFKSLPQGTFFDPLPRSNLSAIKCSHSPFVIRV